MPLFLRTLIGLVAAGCIVALAYFAYSHFFATTVVSDNTVTSTVQDITPAPGFAAVSTATPVLDPNADAPRTLPSGMQEYRNATYHLSLFYPNDLSVKTYDEGAGASTVTFQDVSTAQGFQMFIVPYSQQQISTARFQEDEPSGVMQSPLNIKIDGIAATSFYSTNAALGDTAEIWFLRGGYLYEVTAPKSEAAWFSEIMNTWQFI